jgi:hypothetical protein
MTDNRIFIPKITFSKKSLWLNQAPCFNFELNQDQLLDKALKENFVKKIDDDLYELNFEHKSFKNLVDTDKE